MVDVNRPPVLVTRTGVEGARLLDRLNRIGFSGIHLPLIELGEVNEPEAVARQAQSLGSIDGLILTSREGVRQAQAMGLFDSLRDVMTVVPGAGTGRLAQRAGQRRVRWPSQEAGSSEAMLAMPELDRIAGQRWLILAAEDGRRLLDAGLESRGARVDRLIGYRRKPLSPDKRTLDLLSASSNWVVLLASGGALQRLSSALPAESWSVLQRRLMIVPSQRLAARARRAGVSRIVVSEGASDEAMIESLIKALTPRA